MIVCFFQRGDFNGKPPSRKKTSFDCSPLGVRFLLRYVAEAFLFFKWLLPNFVVIFNVGLWANYVYLIIALSVAEEGP